MRSFPCLLNEVIAEQFHFSKTNSGFRLIEKKESLSVTLNITNNQLHNTCCFEFDKDKPSKIDSIYPFFETSKKGLCTKNDFVLVHQKGYDVYVFLIELKSKNKSEYLKQLRSGKLLFQFIVDKIKLASREWTDFNEEELNRLNFIYKGILFRTHIPLKETSKTLSCEKLDDFDMYFESYANTYYLSQFI